MSDASSGGAKGIIGGIFSLALIAGVIYLKVQRVQSRAERREVQDAAFEADHALWMEHAMQMMRSAPDFKGVGDYLAWGVATFHSDADDMASDGPSYRDALITKIYDRARKDGREDVTRSLDKVRTMARLAAPDTWWVIEKKKK